MEIKASDFHIEIIERTQKLIENYNSENEFSLLVNCLFSLIIIPNENNKKLKLEYLKKDLKDIETINDILLEIEYKFNPTHRDKNTRQFVDSPKTFGCFLKKLRNSITHTNTRPINHNGKWMSLNFIDVNIYNNNNIELDLTLTYNQIKIIAIYISNEFQKEILDL